MDNFNVLHKPLIYSFKQFDPFNLVSKSHSLVNICTEAVDLNGMQKEAFISAGRNSTGWRIPTDESLHLKGLDAAPQPLALHNASLQICLLNQIKKVFQEKNIKVKNVSIKIDTYFNIKGSFFRGDIKSCLKDIVIHFDIQAEISEEELNTCIEKAIKASPLIRAIRYPMQNTFSIKANGKKIKLPPNLQSTLEQVGDPQERINELQKILPQNVTERPILEKKVNSTMEPPKQGEIPVGLLPDIDRTIHIRGTGAVVSDTENIVQTSFYHPLGSVFEYRSDQNDKDISGNKAPSTLIYHGAALAFCFMTQFHRYAIVKKIPFDELRIVQLTPFDLDSSKEKNLSFDTHIFVNGDFSDSFATDLVKMAHQVCFLHAALESDNEIHYSVALNGEEIIYQKQLSN
jgi:uncharacterized OsmC-like protein